MLLAIDTTGSACSSALYDGGLVLAQEHFGEKGHAEMLLPQIETLLQEAGRTMAEVSRIAVTTGPGSFTGVRVGIAAARGLALALGCPIIGLTSFEALAASILSHAGTANFPLKKGDKFGIVLDARRGQVYAQDFVFAGAGVMPSPLTEPEVVDIDDSALRFSDKDVTILGSGAGLVGAKVDSFFSHTDFQHVLARNFCSQIDSFAGVDPTPPVPLYLRDPDAKPGFSFLERG